MNTDWTDARVITGWSLIAAVIITITLAITVGTWHETEVLSAALVECIKTSTATALECRALIFGSN